MEIRYRNIIRVDESEIKYLNKKKEHQDLLVLEEHNYIEVQTRKFYSQFNFTNNKFNLHGL